MPPPATPEPPRAEPTDANVRHLDSQARAPRDAESANPPHLPRDALLTVPAALTGAVLAVIVRDTRGAALDDAQRLSHFPASPMLSLSWVCEGMSLGAVDGGVWWPFRASIMVGGSQSEPVVTWSPQTGFGGMIGFTADVARSLFGIDPSIVHDRFVPAAEVMDAGWQPLLDALRSARDGAAVTQSLQWYLAPRWQALHGRTTDAPSIDQIGRHWLERLGGMAAEWRRTDGPRQVERRVKAFSGRSLRQWHALVRTEGLFFAARERQHEQGSDDQACQQR